MAVELLASGLPTAGVIERLGQKIPPSVIKYFFCSPSMDFKFRILPSDGGLYDQRYRDILEFNIIESRLRFILSRRKDG